VSPIHITNDYNEESEEENYKSRWGYHRRSRLRDEPSSPLTLELEKALWQAWFNAVSLLQYDEYSDPREFLLKYEATVESNGGGSSIKANTFIMATKGPA
jgi:hypothetical protein